MPQERLRGQETAERDAYRGVPDDAEYFVLLDKNHRATPGFRRTYDPEYQDADPHDDVPSLIWEKGESLPAWAVTASAWDVSRFAALDANLERVDTPGPHESTEKIDAPAVLREFRESQNVATKTVFECQTCGDTFENRSQLSGHQSAHSESVDMEELDGEIRGPEGDETDETDETDESDETDVTEETDETDATEETDE